MARLLFLLSLSACVGADAVTIVVPTVSTVLAPPCESLSVGDCDAVAMCAVVTGAALHLDDQGAWCLDDYAPEPLACAADAGCPGVAVVGRASSTSTPYVFPEGCLPQGWEVVPGGVSGCVDPVACADVDLSDCHSSGCTTLEGRPLGTPETDPCIDYGVPPEPLACVEASDGGCGDLEVVASSSEGTSLFLFSSTCIPDGWLLHDVSIEECAEEPIPTP